MSRVPRDFDGTGSLMASIWLVLLLIPASAFVASDASGARTVAGILLLVLFSAVYSVAFGFIETVPRRLTMPQRFAFWFGLLAAIAVATVPVIGANAAFLVPFFTAMLAFPLPVRVSLPSSVVLVLASTGLFWFMEPESMPWAMMATAVSPALIYVIAQAVRREEKRSRLEHDLAISRQRESIAVDVHDLLGHSLTVVTLKAEVASRLVDTDPAASKDEMDQIARISRTALAEVRSTVTRMRSPDIEGEIEAARRALDTAGIAAALPSDVSVAGTNARLFSWAIREGVTNVVRHSRAGRCEVQLGGDRVQVTDDGVGFDDTGCGSGLAGLRERVEDAGGTLTVTTAPGDGTTLLVSMTGEPR
ncbi:MAG: sensor histidine kinase [Mycobacteriaceae bacterium]|uniref:sensor histidine kinase n=1 Tax=Corynebacterium sp. TaxID=1720 RepID=UPI003F95A4AE